MVIVNACAVIIFAPSIHIIKTMNMKLIKQELNIIEPLRVEYLGSLPLFQDIFLEFSVAFANCYLIQLEDETIGYTIVSDENIMLEYFILDDHAAGALAFFNQTIKALNIKSIYCKSFDFQLLDCCISNGYPYQLIGCLYRDFADKGLPVSNNLSFRFANISDLPFLNNQDDEVFEPKELLPQFVENKAIIMLENTGKEIMGCGFITRINPSFNYFDLGVWVSPGHRTKGYATQIMLHMKALCEKNKDVPVCGCDINNTASQRMLKKIGFISKHKIIEFLAEDK
jgi:ribosomal protein S18 acetylase RimI-like enzyme